jgi:hypothetical protein
MLAYLKRATTATLSWLKSHEHLATWAQSIGVISALIFGSYQVRQATKAIKESATANEIAIENRVSDLLVGINMAALDHPEAAGDYTGHKRLHLLRLHYFYRIYGIHSDGLLEEEKFRAEEEYLRWTGSLPDFQAVWSDFRLQYHPGFRSWADNILKNSSKEIADPAEHGDAVQPATDVDSKAMGNEKGEPASNGHSQ